MALDQGIRDDVDVASQVLRLEKALDLTWQLGKRVETGAGYVDLGAI